MPHSYPPRLAGFSYVGRHSYALEFTTFERRVVFVNGEVVDLVLTQILRAATKCGFAVIAYCFMPDHVHLVIDAASERSDAKAFIKSAKQLSGYYFSKAHGYRLWQRYGYERIMRDEVERALTIRYLVANPVRAGLASHPRDYPFVGSQLYTIDELLQICEYSDAVPFD